MQHAPAVALLLGACFVLPALAPATGESSGPERAQWTLVIYCDADNNLESAGVHDINEMETVGSSPEMNVVVQIDRCEGFDTTNGDWKGAKRYLVGSDSDMGTISSREVADLGEVNMGDPETLIDFSKWAIDRYPAEKYALVLWDHGGSWYGACWDDTDDDFLDMANVTAALRAVQRHLGRPIDLVGFDACLMSGIEILYEIRDTCSVAAVSGTTEPDDGWPYDWILPALALKPSMTPPELAREITEDYVNSYSDGKDDPTDTVLATMAAWDMTRTAHLFDLFDQVSMRLALKAFTYNAYLREVRSRTQGYDPGHVVFLDVTNYPLYDIYDFCEQFLKPLGGPFAGLLLDRDLKDAMIALQQALLAARIAEKHGPRYPDGWGLTAYFPSGDNGALQGTPLTQYDARYGRLEFAQDLFWEDFLKAFHAMENLPNTPPSATIRVPAAGAVLDAGAGSVLVAGTAFDAGAVTLVEVSIDNGTWKPAEGTVNWQYRWGLSGLSGRHSVSVRANDGTDTSPVVTREFTVKAAPPGPSASQAGLLVLGALLLAGAAGAFVWSRKKGIPLRELPRRLLARRGRAGSQGE